MDDVSFHATEVEERNHVVNGSPIVRRIDAVNNYES